MKLATNYRKKRCKSGTMQNTLQPDYRMLGKGSFHDRPNEEHQDPSSKNKNKQNKTNFSNIFAGMAIAPIDIGQPMAHQNKGPNLGHFGHYVPTAATADLNFHGPPASFPNIGNHKSGEFSDPSGLMYL